MVILLRSGAEYHMQNGRGVKLKELLAKGTAQRMLDLYGDKSVMISPSAISEVLEDEQFEEREHRLKKEWDCKNGHWHSRNETYCGIEAPNTPSFIHEPIKPLKSNPKVSEAWTHAIKLNIREHALTGVYGKHTAEEYIEQLK